MLYRISSGLFWIFYRIFGRITLIGAENVPSEGGVILAPNHISYLDPPAVGSGLKRQVHYMAKEELFKVPIVGAWIRAVGSFPVKRGAPDRKAFKRALDLLAEGRVVCIFPEGTRSKDGALQEAEMGIGFFAMKSRAPVVPAAVVGTDKMLPPHAKFPRFHKVTILYGKPLTFPDLYDQRDTRQAMQEIGRRTMAAIAELLEGR